MHASPAPTPATPPSSADGRRLRLFPIWRTLRTYNAAAFQGDLIAGINVALLAIPHGIACAMIAGLPVEAVGILCAAVGAIFGSIFCHSRFTNAGPTNATALMLFSAVAVFGPEERTGMLALVVLMASLMLLAGALLRMADLIQFISRSVIVGYLTGAALLIMANQLPGAIGVSKTDFTSQARTFFTLVWQSLSHLHRALPGDVGLALGAVAVWTLFSRLKWTQRLPRFALTLIIFSGIAVLVQRQGVQVTLLRPFALADLTPSFPDLTNSRILDRLGMLFAPAFAVAFLAALENSVMAKSLAGRSGERPDLNQDMFGSGVANLASAFLCGMVVSGSPTRSMLNYTSGAKTQVSSLISGLFCLAGALLLGNAIHFVPRSVLAALIICVAASLIHVRNIRICLRATHGDAVTLVVTFASTLILPLYVAIFVGVAISVALFLRKASRPSLVEYEFTPDGSLTEKELQSGRQNPAISIVHVEGELFFGAAELFRSQIQFTAEDPNLRIIVLRMKNARHLDATSVMALEELVGFLRTHGRDLIVSGLSKDVYKVLKNSGMVEVIGRENLFIGSAQNPNLSTRNALKRAQAILGTKTADVRIFYDPSRPREG